MDPLGETIMQPGALPGALPQTTLQTPPPGSVPPSSLPPTVMGQPAPPTTPARTGGIGLWLDPPAIPVVPGEAASMRVMLANRGAQPVTVALSVTGAPVEWIQLRTWEVYLAPGAEVAVPLGVLVPRTPQNLAGAVLATIGAHAREDPTLAAYAQAMWTIAAFAADSLSVLPPRASGWGSASYTVQVRNAGNAPAEYALYAQDDGADVTCRLTRPYVTVAPASAANVPLHVAGPKRWIDTAEPHTITLRAEPLGRAAPPLGARADFINRAFLPTKALLPLISGVLLLAVIGGLLAFTLPRVGSANPLAHLFPASQDKGSKHTGAESTSPTAGATATLENPPAGAPVWKTLPAMPSARTAVGAATGSDGRIYVIGGYTDRPVNYVQAYIPQTKAWTNVTPLQTARSGAAVARTPDGRIYAIGGYTSPYSNGSYKILNTVEVYTPATRKWTFVASLPNARADLAATLGPDGKIYAIGGSTGAVTNEVDAYDPAKNAWKTIASLPTARSQLAAATGPDGKIYAIGGFGGATLGTVEVYTPSANSWSKAADLPTHRQQLSAVIGSDGQIYAIGGYNGSDVATVESYSTDSHTWRKANALTVARNSLGTAVGQDGHIYAVGGATNGSAGAKALNTLEVLA